MSRHSQMPLSWSRLFIPAALPTSLAHCPPEPETHSSEEPGLARNETTACLLVPALALLMLPEAPLQVHCSFSALSCQGGLREIPGVWAAQRPFLFFQRKSLPALVADLGAIWSLCGEPGQGWGNCLCKRHSDAWSRNCGRAKHWASDLKPPQGASQCPPAHQSWTEAHSL